ncbi:hypothetical protein C2845_PM01G28410 [Panicum miliaceum]|uniref:Uncharacterized protein n=1 Tax=Panicum miliaceum TaxID=4540 RepID=A0A3L6TKN1_PANMI|nr:hypothetical protein C2845_PM01G28410 [Panicum miliaceum]
MGSLPRERRGFGRIPRRSLLSKRSLRESASPASLPSAFYRSASFLAKPKRRLRPRHPSPSNPLARDPACPCPPPPPPPHSSATSAAATLRSFGLPPSPPFARIDQPSIPSRPPAPTIRITAAPCPPADPPIEALPRDFRRRPRRARHPPIRHVAVPSRHHLTPPRRSSATANRGHPPPRRSSLPPPSLICSPVLPVSPPPCAVPRRPRGREGGRG